MDGVDGAGKHSPIEPGIYEHQADLNGEFLFIRDRHFRVWIQVVISGMDDFQWDFGGGFCSFPHRFPDDFPEIH